MRTSRRWFSRVRARGTVLGSLLAASVLAVACSDDPLTQAGARDNGAAAVCDLQARCGQIGDPPATFANRDACLTTWKGYIQAAWPPADCMHIVRAEYDMCLASVQNSACASGLDLLVSLDKCSKARVCGVP